MRYQLSNIHFSITGTACVGSRVNTTRNMLFVVVVVEKAFVVKSARVLKRVNTTRNMLFVVVVVEKAFVVKSARVPKRVNTTRNMLVVVVVVVVQKAFVAKSTRVLKRVKTTRNMLFVVVVEKAFVAQTETMKQHNELSISITRKKSYNVVTDKNAAGWTILLPSPSTHLLCSFCHSPPHPHPHLPAPSPPPNPHPSPDPLLHPDPNKPS